MNYGLIENLHLESWLDVCKHAKTSSYLSTAHLFN